MPSSSSGYNAQNQATTGGAQYLNGSLKQIGSYWFGYDAENWMTSSQISGHGSVTYTYDG